MPQMRQPQLCDAGRLQHAQVWRSPTRVSRRRGGARQRSRQRSALGAGGQVGAGRLGRAGRLVEVRLRQPEFPAPDCVQWTELQPAATSVRWDGRRHEYYVRRCYERDGRDGRLRYGHGPEHGLHGRRGCDDLHVRAGPSRCSSGQLAVPELWQCQLPVANHVQQAQLRAPAAVVRRHARQRASRRPCRTPCVPAPRSPCVALL